MSWLIILVVLLAAFGPILWLVPSKRDRRLTAMRQQARQEGMTVEMRRLPKVDPLPEERVTAGGRVLQPVEDLAVYQWPLSRRIRHLPAWRLVRHGQGIQALPDWAFEIGRKPQHPQLDASLEVLGTLLAGLPEDVLAIECEDRQLSAYWKESPGSGPAQVTEIARLLASASQALEALELKLEAEAEEGKI
jgi:hypothetical protein